MDDQPFFTNRDSLGLKETVNLPPLIWVLFSLAKQNGIDLFSYKIPSSSSSSLYIYEVPMRQNVGSITGFHLTMISPHDAFNTTTPTNTPQPSLSINIYSDFTRTERKERSNIDGR
jgi:hypothetical protein